MASVVIANPILNSPFEEPTRHFRFSDDGSFLIVTPGITIRDRLRVLLPSDTETYYRRPSPR